MANDSPTTSLAAVATHALQALRMGWFLPLVHRLQLLA